MTIKPIAQTAVSAACPECGFKHEFPLEKGKNGKPFFTACSRCKAEFAVRFVPAMIYQAQVAGFR
jgi:DNA-directed RNA polymerase subunit RPC12/RpoP